MEIKFEDYLSDEERKEIVRNVFEKKVYETLNRSSADVIISNAGYEVIFKAVDELIGESATKLIEKKVVQIIGDMSSYCVFRDDSYGGKKSKAHILMENAVEDNKSLINCRVKAVISGMTDENFKYEIEDYLNEKIHGALFGKDDENAVDG